VFIGHSGSLINGKSRRCWLGHVISCVQSQLITWDIYTDQQGTNDQCVLMICVAPAVPPVSVHQCQLSVLIHATCQCPSVPHQCHISVPTSAHRCPSELPFSVTHQCQSVPPINVSQCHLSVPPISASQCHWSVPPICVHQ
ncbi:unnamed protein product, partial [Staurois parvus]